MIIQRNSVSFLELSEKLITFAFDKLINKVFTTIYERKKTEICKALLQGL